MTENLINTKNSSITYENAGVDVDEGNKLVSDISHITASTSITGTTAKIGGFGGLFDLKKSGFKDPLLVSSTDGVGTKLQLAIKTKLYFNIGVDLVAMCANDILVQGAKPLFFLDYYATGKLNRETAIQVIKGIAAGCKEAGCALIGGETAEMPGHYDNGSFDLAGFCVGAVERNRLLDGKKVKANDCVIAISSSGVHSNGYSLIRKVIDTHSIDISQISEFERTKSYSEILMRPTIIYSKAFFAANKDNRVKSACHITGGGLIENPPRSFNKDLTLKFNMKNYKLPPLFDWLKEKANISLYDMAKTFNCGIGFLIFADNKDASNIINNINDAGYNAFIIGSIEENKFNKNVIFNGWDI